MRSKLSRRFSGRSVLVTGGSSGIGLSCARQLVRMGARVILAAPRRDALEGARSALLEPAPEASIHLLSVDVADELAVESVVGGHLSQHPVDILFNNAGVVMPGRFLELRPTHLRQMMETNYFGAVNMCRVVLILRKNNLPNSL